MPENHHIAWIIRYLIITPPLLVIIAFSNKPFIKNKIQSWMTAMTVFAQLGIVAMIYFAEPGSIAAQTYYVGLILMSLWAGFIFQLLPLHTILISASGIIFYNILVIFRQNIIISETELDYLVNNNFFLITASVFSVFGSFLLENYRKQQKEDERKLQVEKEELINARRRAEMSDELKSQFLSNLSHEIRTPMNAIVGFSGLLSQEMLPENFEAYKKEISDKSYYLLDVIQDIIELSRLQTGNAKVLHEKLDTKKLFAELRLLIDKKLYEADKKDKVAIVYKIDEKVKSLSLNTDTNRIFSVLDKLLDNAIKFTSEGFITIHCYADDTNLCFEIQDTGIGIKEYNLSYIFEQFRQVDEGSNPKKGGLGTGLYIASETLKLLGGELKVESEFDKGSTFYFCLPFSN